MAEREALTQLRQAVKDGNLDLVKSLTQDGSIDVNTKDGGGETILMRASMYSHPHVVQYLVRSCKANANSVNNYGSTALIYAASQGTDDIVQCLVGEGGAKVDVHNREGDTPLIAASRGGHVKVVEYLTRAQADVNARDNAKRTALMWAAKGGHFNVAQLLCNAHADPHALSQRNESALLFALKAQHCDLGLWLIHTHLCSLNTKDQDGLSPFAAADQTTRASIIQSVIPPNILESIRTSVEDSLAHLSLHPPPEYYGDSHFVAPMAAPSAEGLRRVLRLVGETSVALSSLPNEERDALNPKEFEKARDEILGIGRKYLLAFREAFRSDGGVRMLVEVYRSGRSLHAGIYDEVLKKVRREGGPDLATLIAFANEMSRQAQAVRGDTENNFIISIIIDCFARGSCVCGLGVHSIITQHHSHPTQYT
eukprot:c13725_g1_i1.p1 GENE.c13725_g1_i1~~c13725_g1_i1.p1  ORF type:complete len:425 (+),score=61.44 c13725_g1_i1:36-1310(+)